MSKIKTIYRIKFLLLILTVLNGCNENSITKNSKITFVNSQYDLGILQLNEQKEFKIPFSNSGEIPLVIQNVKTSCGCTLPEWPKKPIKPGKEETLILKYDATHPGRFQKTIKVFYNGEGSPMVITIKGSVQAVNSDSLFLYSD